MWNFEQLSWFSVWMTRIRMPAGAGNFSFLQYVQTGWGPTQYVPGLFSPAVKRPERETNVTDEWRCRQIPSYTITTWTGTAVPFVTTEVWVAQLVQCLCCRPEYSTVRYGTVQSGLNSPLWIPICLTQSVQTGYGPHSVHCPVHTGKFLPGVKAAGASS
jgi:hypothetical protein